MPCMQGIFLHGRDILTALILITPAISFFVSLRALDYNKENTLPFTGCDE